MPTRTTRESESSALRMVQHVFAEIALAAIGAGFGLAALDVAILAAGRIFVRTLRHRAVGPAIDVVIHGQRPRDRGLPALQAGTEQRADQQQRDDCSYRVASHVS